MTSTRPVRLLSSVILATLTCAATLTAAPAFAQAVIVAPMAPPPPRVEVMPAPRNGYVWDQGRWRWGPWPLRVGAGPLATGARRLSLGAGSLGAARPELALGRRPLGMNRTRRGNP